MVKEGVFVPLKNRGVATKRGDEKTDHIIINSSSRSVFKKPYTALVFTPLELTIGFLLKAK